MADSERRENEGDGEIVNTEDVQQLGPRESRSEGEKILEMYTQKPLPEQWMEKEVRVVRVFKEVMEKGGPFKVKIKGKDMAKVRRVIENKVIRGGVGIEDPFEESVKEKRGIKYEIHRLVKRQNEMINTFNEMAILMKDIDRIGDEDVEEDEMWRIYESLKKHWKVAFIEHTKAMSDLGEDLVKLEFRSRGMRPPSESPDVELVTDEIKSRVKESMEERRLDAMEKIASGSSMGSRGFTRGRGYYPSSSSSGQGSYGDGSAYGRGRGRGWSRGNGRAGSRGRGRGSRN